MRAGRILQGEPLNSEHYLAAGLAPSLLPLLEPSATPCSVGIDWGAPGGAETVTGTYNPATGQVTDIRTVSDAHSDAVRRILRTTSDACARWFKVVRTALGRERDRQQKFRVEHGLPKSARLPYQKPSVEPDERAAAEAAEATLRCLYGDEVADYAGAKFRRAIETGDMRAFKIRLLVLKARDSLAGTALFPDFIAGIENCISTAEEIAGCTPDPSPRRLSRAEQERKRKREELLALEKEQRTKPNLGLPTAHSSEAGKTGTKSGRTTGNSSAQATIQDIEHQDIEPNKATQIIPVSSSSDVASAPSPETRQNSISCKTAVDEKNDSQIKSKRKLNGANKNAQIAPVTVTHNTSVTVTPKKRTIRSKLVRKTKDYATVEEILADVEAGLIVPYETDKEICSDVQAGLLTETESILFTLALDRYNPLESAGVDSESTLEMDRVRIEEYDGEQDDEELEEDEAGAGDERSGLGPSISYNPQGFGGCGGSYTGSGMDWNPDDE